MFIPTSYVPSTMGRQKTLWIDEESWEKLEAMGDDSVSAKVRRCIISHDIESEAVRDALNSHVAALKRQIEILKDALKKAKIDGWWND